MVSEATPSQVFQWYTSVAQYAQGMGVYVPPLHTVQPGKIFGRWESDLPAEYLSQTDYFNTVLSQALRSKGTNLFGTKRHEILRPERDALRLLYRVLELAKHPRLTLGVAAEDIPRQRYDQSMADYYVEFMHSAICAFVTGRVFSDRYFVESFIVNLHPAIKQPASAYWLMLTRQTVINVFPFSFSEI